MLDEPGGPLKAANQAIVSFKTNHLCYLCFKLKSPLENALRHRRKKRIYRMTAGGWEADVCCQQ
jgi:hypothetical protein